MSMSRSTTAVSCPVTSEIAVARLDVRKVLPVPPLEEKTDRILPRVMGWPSVEVTLTERRLPAQTIARSTASRSSSVPWVMSTTSRMPARIAAGSSPFHVWSRTSTMAVPGAWRPTNSARPSASGSLTSGERTRTSMGWKALINNSSAAVADCTQPTSSGPISMALATCWRNDCGVPTATTLASVIRASLRAGARSERSKPRGCVPSSSGGRRPSQIRAFSCANTRFCASCGKRSNVIWIRELSLRPVSVSTCGFWMRRTRTVGTSVTVKSGTSFLAPACASAGLSSGTDAGRPGST